MYVLLQTRPIIKALAISSDRKALVYEETELYRALSSKELVNTVFQIDYVQTVEETNRPLGEDVMKHLRPKQ